MYFPLGECHKIFASSFLSNNLNLAPDAYGLLTSKVAENLLSY
jgi:hypothetical protein